jgi:uncharacterized protein (DUF1697 family)
MPRYAAFLRAVNLGRNRRVSGADLRSLFEAMGLEEVATFRTSGNVAFTAGSEPVAKLTGRIEASLERALGHEAVVFLRSAGEVRAIAAHEPFDPGIVAASKGKLQVSLLGATPPAGARDEVLALATDEDLLAFGERELYWLPSGGTQTSELDTTAIATLLGPSTMRTKGTIEQLAAKHFGV